MIAPTTQPARQLAGPARAHDELLRGGCVFDRRGHDGNANRAGGANRDTGPVQQMTGSEPRRVVRARALDDTGPVRRHQRGRRAHPDVDPRRSRPGPPASARPSSPRPTSPGSPSTAWIWSDCRSATGRSATYRPYLSAVELLDAAMDWAHTYGLKVLLDMHGAIGSQNGRDHSGLVGRRGFYDLLQHREDSLEALAELATRYAQHPALWGIELVNEPTDPRVWRLWEFHHRAYRRLTEILVPGTRVVFSDGYLPWILSGTLRGQHRLPGGSGLPLLPGVLPLGHPQDLRAAPGQGPAARQADRPTAAACSRCWSGSGVRRWIRRR